MLSENICQQERIVAYVDGELDGSALSDFEQHLTNCEACRRDLRSQRQFFCELDSAIANDLAMSAPSNFARIVAARAENDMRGMRSSTEHKRALRLIAILAFGAFALLGVSAINIIVSGARLLARNVAGIASFAGATLYDAGSSAVVVSRVLTRKFFIESGSLGLLVIFLVLAVVLLSHLIASYHRQSTSE